MMKMDPLNHFAAFEKYYAGKEEDAKNYWNHESPENSGMKHLLNWLYGI